MFNRSKKSIKILAGIFALMSLCFGEKSNALSDIYSAFQSVLSAAPATDSIMKEGLAAWWELLPEGMLKDRLAQIYKNKFHVLPATVHISLASIQDCLGRESQHLDNIEKLNKQNLNLQQDVKKQIITCKQGQDAILAAHGTEKEGLNKQLSACNTKYNQQKNELQANVSGFKECEIALGVQKSDHEKLLKQLTELDAQLKAHKQSVGTLGGKNQELQGKHDTCITESSSVNGQLSSCKQELTSTKNTYDECEKTLSGLKQENQDLRDLMSREGQEKLNLIYDANKEFIEKDDKLKESVAVIRAIKTPSNTDHSKAAEATMEEFGTNLELAHRALSAAKKATDRLNQSIENLVPGVENGIRARATVDKSSNTSIGIFDSTFQHYYEVNTYEAAVSEMARSSRVRNLT